MWVLVWVQLLANSQNIQYYQFENYATKRACDDALKEASVMLTHKNESLICIGLEGMKEQ